MEGKEFSEIEFLVEVLISRTSTSTLKLLGNTIYHCAKLNLTE